MDEKKSDEDLVKELFYNPKTGFISAYKVYKKLKERGNDIKLREVEDILKEQEVNQIYKPKGRNDFIPIVARGIRDIYQMDLLDVSQYSKWNKGYNWIMNVLDVYSRYALSLPMKTKTIEDVLPTFKKAVETLGKPKNLTTDLESAVMSNEFQEYLNKEKITHYAIDPEKKRNNSIVERFNRTLRESIRNVLFAFDTNDWLEYLDSIIENYNMTIHRTINATPYSIFIDKEPLPKVKALIKPPVKSEQSFEVGDVVRYLKQPANRFEKLSMAERYTRTTFKVIGMNKNRYILEGEDDAIVEKLPSELQKVDKIQTFKASDTARQDYATEKIERKGRQIRKKEDISEASIVEGKRIRKPKTMLDL